MSRIKLTFSVRIALSAATLLLAALGLAAYLSFRQHSQHLMGIVEEELSAIMRNSSYIFSSQAIDYASPEGRRKAVEELEALSERNPAMETFRLLVFVEGQARLLASTVRGGEVRGDTARPYNPEEPLRSILAECLEMRHTCVTEIYETPAGRRISAFTPIADAEGAVAAVVGADRRAVAYEQALRQSVRETFYYSIAAFAAAALLGAFLSSRVTRPLRRLFKASREASAGRFVRLEPTGSNEVATLTRAFNETNETLLEKMAELEALTKELEERVSQRTQELEESYEEVRKRQDFLQREIGIARRVQETIVPRRFEDERIRVEVEYLPIIGLGGDWGIVAQREEGRLDVAVGDVTGHGIGAALVVNRVYTLLSQLCSAEAGIDALLNQLDYFLAEEIADIGIYMTFMACRFDLRSMELEFAGAGHPPVIVQRADGTLVHLESHCGLLGVGELFCDVPAVRTFPLEKGDLLVFHTDGLMEAQSGDDEAFGLERLEETIVSSSDNGRDAGKLISRITEEVKRFTGGYLQDDVLLIVAQVR